MSKIINPYIAGAPVTEARMFFGREDVFDWITRSLPGRYVDHILVIHGQRRVGKTSVLKQLHHHLPDRYIPVFFDLQGRTRTTLERLLWWLAREITRALKQDQDIVIPMPEHEDFVQNPEYLEAHFLPACQAQLSNRNLLLTFDEFDSLEETDVKEPLARPLIDYLKRLMGQENLNFIFSIGSSGRKLENMQAEYTEFFKAALYREISFLGRDDTRSLITQPVEGILEWTRKAVDRIYWITSGHPYFTQLVCHELFSRFQKSGERRISHSDVDAVLGDVVERGTVNLKFVWDEAADLEKWILASLVRMGDRSKPHEIAEVLEGQRVRFSPKDLDSALLHLCEKDVLTDENEFVNHLLRIWLQENRPLERVREELIEVNPIANRYIEIGQEYRDVRAYDKAIESFQDALRVDPDNVRAQVNIASIRLEQKAFEEAAAEYEKALTMDDEDVAAKAGLCQAHLALGDQALAKGKGKDAIRSYQQVLAINADHTDARQRMADIHGQRAEQAVSEGRFAEAFDAFREALDFVPEDGQLESRFEEIRKKHRATVVDALKVKAEKARSEKHWDQAVAFLEEALQLTPEEPATSEMLANIRQEHREDQLENLKHKARRFAGAERWDEALASWQAYLALDPEDQEAALSELQQVETERKRSDEYAQARQAMADKDYDRAVGMLKGIILEDETYKDTAVLLAQSIEAQRAKRPPALRRWLIGSLGVIALAVLGWWLSMPASPLRTMIFGPQEAVSETVTVSATPAAGSQPTSSPQPVDELAATATPDWPYWMNLFAIPALAVRDSEPDFSDDFSTLKPEWGPLMSGVEIDAGILSLNTTAGKPGITIPKAAGDFVLEFDLVISSKSSDGFEFEVHLRERDNAAYKFLLHEDRFGFSYWYVVLEEGEASNEIISGSMDRIEMGVKANLVLIVYEDQFAVLLDGNPLCYFNDSSLFGSRNSILAQSFSGPAEVHIDNLRFWSLDADWVQEIAWPMLDRLDAIAPDAEFDFETSPVGFVRALDPDSYLDEGILKVFFQDKFNNFLDFTGSDFAIAFEFSPISSFEEAYLIISMRRGLENDWIDHQVHYVFQTGEWNLIYQDAEGWRDIAVGHISHVIEEGTWAEMMVIWWNQYLLVLLDGRPLVHHGPMLVEVLSSDHHEIQLDSVGGETELYVDNLRYWDLSAVEPFD